MIRRRSDHGKAAPVAAAVGSRADSSPHIAAARLGPRFRRYRGAAKLGRQHRIAGRRGTVKISLQLAGIKAVHIARKHQRIGTAGGAQHPAAALARAPGSRPSHRSRTGLASLPASASGCIAPSASAAPGCSSAPSTTPVLAPAMLPVPRPAACVAARSRSLQAAADRACCRRALARAGLRASDTGGRPARGSAPACPSRNARRCACRRSARLRRRRRQPHRHMLVERLVGSGPALHEGRVAAGRRGHCA